MSSEFHNFHSTTRPVGNWRNMLRNDCANDHRRLVRRQLSYNCNFSILPCHSCWQVGALSFTSGSSVFGKKYLICNEHIIFIVLGFILVTACCLVVLQWIRLYHRCLHSADYGRLAVGPAGKMQANDFVFTSTSSQTVFFRRHTFIS